MDFVDLGQQNGDVDGHGCDSEPNVATDQKMAAELAAKLHALKGW